MANADRAGHGAGFSFEEHLTSEGTVTIPTCSKGLGDKGYATEAARACRDWGAEHLGVARLVSLINLTIARPSG